MLKVVEEYCGVRPTRFCNRSFGARCGALQQVVVPPLPREDVKGWYSDACCIAMIVIVLPMDEVIGFPLSC